MTSLAVRPANRARKPPMAWIPSCEFPANRITASWILRAPGGRWPPGAAEESATFSSIIFVSLKDYPSAEVAPETQSLQYNKTHDYTGNINKRLTAVNHETAWVQEKQLTVREGCYILRVVT